MMKSICLSTGRHSGSEIRGYSPHEIMLLAWPLILQWRKSFRQKPPMTDQEAMLFIDLQDGSGWGTPIEHIKRDTLTHFIMQYAWEK